MTPKVHLWNVKTMDPTKDGSYVRSGDHLKVNIPPTVDTHNCGVTVMKAKKVLINTSMSRTMLNPPFKFIHC